MMASKKGKEKEESGKREIAKENALETERDDTRNGRKKGEEGR